MSDDGKQDPQTGKPYPWITRGSGLPYHYYFCLLDADFGPLFMKFSSYIPYAVKVCLNGHEGLKQQLTKAGIPFTVLDNGVLSSTDPVRLQQLCDALDADTSAAAFRKRPEVRLLRPTRHRLHWSLDALFGEDQARMRLGNAKENVWMLRRLALNLFRRDCSVKAGIKTRRLLAASDDAYRQKLFNIQAIV